MMKLKSRFVLETVLFVGLLSTLATPLAKAEERARNISSLSQLAAPDLSQAVQNAGKSNVPYFPVDLAVNVSTAPKSEKLRSGISLPAYSNSFPNMIAQVRTENWDQ
jgi:hypothetical protein